jgi:probable rRNA maturation factor
LADAEWSLVLTDDHELRALNLGYRAIDRTTDVLSFAQLDAELLGDVVISVEQAARQAPEGDLEAELVRLMVHGLCHLRGFDHEGGGAEARAMRAEEARLLAALGTVCAPIERGEEDIAGAR